MPDMKMDYDQVEDMMAAFRRAAERFDQIRANLQKAGALLEEGALRGVSGERLLEVLSQRLVTKVNNGHDRFEQINTELNSAMDAMRDSDRTSGGYFN